MSNKNNAKKGKRAEQKVEKGIGGVRKAGPNNPDIKRGQDIIEVKDYKKPLIKDQLQKAYQQIMLTLLYLLKDLMKRL